MTAEGQNTRSKGSRGFSVALDGATLHSQLAIGLDDMTQRSWYQIPRGRLPRAFQVEVLTFLRYPQSKGYPTHSAQFELIIARDSLKARL